MKIECLLSSMCLVCLFLVPANVVQGGWDWENPLPQGNDLNDMWGSSSNAIFAVGSHGTIMYYLNFAREQGHKVENHLGFLL